MKQISYVLLVGLVLTLVGCGGPRISERLKKKKDDQASSVVTPPPSAPYVAPVAPPPSQSQDVTPPVTPAPTVATQKLSSGSGEFAENMVGGRSIEAWIKLLNSEKKDDVIEACAALAIVGNKASSATPKLTELSKSADKDIAAEAQETLKKITNK